jgi:hypothetical protein
VIFFKLTRETFKTQTVVTEAEPSDAMAKRRNQVSIEVASYLGLIAKTS